MKIEQGLSELWYGELAVCVAKWPADIIIFDTANRLSELTSFDPESHAKATELGVRPRECRIIFLLPAARSCHPENKLRHP